MGSPSWQDILNMTSGGRSSDTSLETPAIPGRHEVQIPSLGEMPNDIIPDNTRFRWLKRLILRVLRVYSRGQSQVQFWTYSRLEEHVNVLQKLSAKLSDLERHHDELRSTQTGLSIDINDMKSKSGELETSVEMVRTFVEQQAHIAKEDFQNKYNELKVETEARYALWEQKLREQKSSDTILEIGRQLARMELKISSIASLITERDNATVSSVVPDSEKFYRGIESVFRHDGFLAKANLWFNNPLVFEIRDGVPVVAQINERIVEPAESMAAVRRYAPQGARVLDVGCAESLVPFQYAVMGYRVTAIDIRPYPLRHPNLVSVSGDFFHAALPDSQFQFISCISTLEHFGLGWYDDPRTDETADIRALAKIRSLLSPGGYLFLTTPVASEFSTSSFERIYSVPRIQEIVSVSGLSLQELTIYSRVGSSQWVRNEVVEDLGEQPAVAIIIAKKEY